MMREELLSGEKESQATNEFLSSFVLLAAIEGPGEHAAPEKRWLYSGLRNCLTGKADSLDEALGIKSWPRTRANTRNDLLYRAARELSNGARPNAAALFRACKDFERRRWPSWRQLDGPPESAEAWERDLFWARLMGEFPCERQLRNILNDKL